jgi:hypothetical protein
MKVTAKNSSVAFNMIQVEKKWYISAKQWKDPCGDQKINKIK